MYSEDGIMKQDADILKALPDEYTNLTALSFECGQNPWEMVEIKLPMEIILQ